MAIRINNDVVIDNSKNFIGTALTVTSIYASGTVGTAGSILSSTGTGLQWIDPAGGFNVSESSSSTTHYPIFVDVTSGRTLNTNIASSKLTFTPSTGNFSATQLTTLSDRSQKTNIKVIENPIEITKELEGVTFDWIHTNQPSMGVIAQDVEKILPELVETGEDGLKRVNYSGMIGLLIETIKEQQVRIEELERKINV